MSDNMSEVSSVYEEKKEMLQEFNANIHVGENGEFEFIDESQKKDVFMPNNFLDEEKMFFDLGRMETEVQKRILQRADENMQVPARHLKASDHSEVKDGRFEIESKLKTHSHRFDKTRKKKLNTSVNKLIKVNKEITKIKNDDENSNITWEEKIARQEQLFTAIHSADRYFAEGFAASKKEEDDMKLSADYKHFQRLDEYYIGEGKMICERIEALNKQSYAPKSKEAKIREAELRDLKAKQNYLDKKAKPLNKLKAKFLNKNKKNS